ncbi:hypothetical protein ABNF97_21105 [Plantactinospora sp. B6F1]
MPRRALDDSLSDQLSVARADFVREDAAHQLIAGEPQPVNRQDAASHL